MTTFKINCFLNSNCIEAIKELNGKPVNIYSEIFDGKTTIVKIQSEDTVFYMTNEPTVQKDGDEYPVVTIKTKMMILFDSNFDLINGELINLYLIRDKMTWERDGSEWEVNIDIGIKIITIQREVCFIALDSCGGLMNFMEGNEIYIPSDLIELKEHWDYKADDFISLSRDLIQII
jgi:hypothetical protein